MTDETPIDRDFIALARAGQSPSTQDRKRVLKLIVAAPLVAVPLVAGAPEAAAGGSKVLAWLATLGAKPLVAGALVIGGTAGGAVVAFSDDEAQHKPAIHTLPSSSVSSSEPHRPNDAMEQAEAAPLEEALPGSEPAAKELPPASIPQPKPQSPIQERPPRDQLAEDVALLQQGQLALKAADPAQALRHVAQHRQQFPNSALSQERNVVRIFALCGLGRVDQARREARSMLGESEKSPMRVALRNSCAITD